MKSLVRTAVRFITKTTAKQTAALGVASALGAGLIGVIATRPAIAIPQAQIAEKLTNVPVYVIRNGDGLLLVPSAQTDPEQPAEPSLLVFMGRTEAETLLAEATEADPEFAANLQIATTSLERVYAQFQNNPEESLRLRYVPERAEASQADDIDEAYRGGVPLFYPQLEDGSLAAIPDSTGENVFPMFFSYSDLDFVLSEIEAQNPEARAAITVGILPLEDMLYEMQNSDDEKLNQVRLLPDSEVINNVVESESAAPAPTE